MKNVQILTSCDAPGCLTLSTRTMAPDDRLPEGLPDDWTQLDDGKTICFRHKVLTFTFIDGKRLR